MHTGRVTDDSDPMGQPVNRIADINRRWLIAGLCVVILIGVVIYETLFNRPSAECRPVRDLLDFNRSQSEEIAADDGAQPNLAAYRSWADGMAERAGKVENPELAPHAIRLAEAANRFVVVLPQVPAGRDAQAPPGMKPPPAYYELATLNDHITAETQILSEKCPA